MFYLNLKPDCLGLHGQVTALRNSGTSLFFLSLYFIFSFFILLYTIPHGNDGGGELWVCF